MSMAANGQAALNIRKVLAKSGCPGISFVWPLQSRIQGPRALWSAGELLKRLWESQSLILFIVKKSSFLSFTLSKIEIYKY